MPNWLLFTLTLAGLFSVVPLFVLGATGGNWRQAWHALKQYLLCMGIIAIPAALYALGYGIWFMFQP